LNIQSKSKFLKKNRVIARLDIKGPNLIKGINFEGLKVIGSPVEFAEQYYHNGIDELIYIDTVATLYGRNNLLQLVKEVGKKVFIPITVGGGIRTIEDARSFLNAGADKIGINTAAVQNPKILKEISSRFGNQCVVLIIDAKKIRENYWEVFTENGREKTGKNVIEWAKEADSLGIGEVLITSIDKDGTQKGPDIDLVKEVKKVIDVPLIVSGGIGKINHIESLFLETKNYNFAIGTALHKKTLKISEIKKFLKLNNFQINR
jgi:imidazole glycerol-phosphate synthase subunit HisF